MKRFLSISFILLLFALGASVLVWYLVQDSLRSATQEQVLQEKVSPENLQGITPPSPTEQSVEDTGVNATSSSPNEIQESIPLRTLSFTEDQMRALSIVGIDVDTFIVAPSMINCADQALGRERFDAIIGGDAPGVIESARLIGCIDSE